MLNNPFYCSSCAHRGPAPGFCETCPDEPLLDLREADVRITLDELDARARHSRQGKVVLGSVALVGIPTWFAVAGLVGDVLGILVAAALASGVAAAIMIFFPARRRMPELTDAEFASIARP